MFLAGIRLQFCYPLPILHYLITVISGGTYTVHTNPAATSVTGPDCRTVGRITEEPKRQFDCPASQTSASPPRSLTHPSNWYRMLFHHGVEMVAAWRRPIASTYSPLNSTLPSVSMTQHLIGHRTFHLLQQYEIYGCRIAWHSDNYTAGLWNSRICLLVCRALYNIALQFTSLGSIYRIAMQTLYIQTTKQKWCKASPCLTADIWGTDGVKFAH